MRRCLLIEVAHTSGISRHLGMDVSPDGQARSNEFTNNSRVSRGLVLAVQRDRVLVVGGLDNACLL